MPFVRSRVRPATQTLYVNGPNDTGFQNRPGYVGNIAGSGLINDAGATTIQSNTTYTGYYQLAFGQIGTPAAPVHNVTLNGCCWENQGTNSPNVIICADGPVTFNYCTIRPAGLTDGTNRPQGVDGYQFGLLGDGTQASPGTWNSFCKTLTVNRCDIWGASNASKIALSDAANPHVFSNNWVHSARLNNIPGYDDHTDGLGSPGGGTASYVTYTGNRIESEGDTNGLVYQTQPGGNSVWDHFTITGNLFGGWGNCVNITDGAPLAQTGSQYITFTDNTFSTKYDCALAVMYDAGFATATGSTWRRNKWLVPPGAYWGTSGNSGKFWIPNHDNRNRTTGDDTPFVSSTDFTG